MQADDIRCANDLALYEKLTQHRDVKRVNEQIAKHEAEGPSGVRRNLLATSVRLTEGMAPDIAKMADECVEKLGVKLALVQTRWRTPVRHVFIKPVRGLQFQGAQICDGA